MFRTTLVNIFNETWPMLLIITVIAVSMRITWLIKNKSSFVLYKEILYLGFILYVICLFYVVTFQDASWTTSNFIPFKEMFRYRFLSRLFFRNVIGNLVMFIPFGFFVAYILKLTKARYVFFLSLLTSITIECTQLVIGRVFDVDDIMLNILGGVLGFYLYFIIDKVKDRLPKFLQSNIVSNIIVIIIVICFILYIFEAGGIL